MYNLYYIDSLQLSYRHSYPAVLHIVNYLTYSCHIHHIREDSPRQVKSKGYTKRADVFVFIGLPGLDITSLRAVGCLRDKYGPVAHTDCPTIYFLD